MKWWLTLCALGVVLGVGAEETVDADTAGKEENTESNREKRQAPFGYGGFGSAYGYPIHSTMYKLGVEIARAKPSAHIVGNEQRSYHVNRPGKLSFWKQEFVNGGMKFEKNSSLVVPVEGVYWCYAQVYFNTGRDTPRDVNGRHTVNPPSPRHQVDARFYIFVNDQRPPRMLSSQQPAVETSAYTGGQLYLKANDNVTIHIYTPNVKIWKGGEHTFFGCYLI